MNVRFPIHSVSAFVNPQVTTPQPEEKNPVGVFHGLIDPVRNTL